MKGLILPVYLNQKVVFDLLAMLEGGISTVTAITESSSTESGNNTKISSSFGLSEAFSTLLKINLAGSTADTQKSNDGKIKSEERIHTPASLFYQLRNTLIEQNYLNKVEQDITPTPGDFIEFEGTLNKNPITETIDSMAEILEISDLFSVNKKKSESSGYMKLKSKLNTFSNSLKTGNTIDLTANNIFSKYKAVITLDKTFLNDQHMSDLVDGKFKVLAKVIKNVSFDESINLLRNNSVNKMPKEAIQQLLQVFERLGSEQGFNIPTLHTEVKGPAIQVIPIAIYA